MVIGGLAAAERMLERIPRPSRLYGWLALGLAAYCFAEVIGDWRTRGWLETPAEEVWLASTSQRRVVRDTLGRPRTRWAESHPVLGYRYRIEGATYRGFWNGSGQLLEPVVVVYDPAHPAQSTLRTPPTSPAIHAVGWASLAFGFLVFGLRRVRRDARARVAPTEGEQPTRRERTVFRALVLTDLAILLVRQGIEKSVDRVPPEVWEQIAEHLEPGPLYEMSGDLYPVAFGLTLIASLGLLTFWRPARQLYLLTWCWWLAVTWFGDPWIDFGFEAFLRQAGRLLGGAILAMSFYGPVGKAFTARRRPDLPGKPEREQEPATKRRQE